MRQLNSWDAAFLYGESRVTPMNICSVAHFAPAPDGQRLTLEEVRSAVVRNLPRLPPFRQRVVHAPFGLGRPHWAEDPDLNVDDHLHEVSLPAPGDRTQLAEQVSLIAARPLDLTRPLWEIHLISGLESGEAVLVTKFHHAAVDGGSAGEMMPIILDPAPDSPEMTVGQLRQPGGLPRPGEMMLRGLAGAASYPLHVMHVQRRMMSRLPHMAGLVRPPGQETGHRAPADAEGIRRRDWQPPMFGAPRAPFNGRLTKDRCWAFGQVPLDQVKAIKNAFGGTVNDVVMAVCAAALREWLLGQGALPKDPLVAMIPVSVRADEERGTFGNRVSMMMSALPTTVADPVQRLQAASAAAAAAKRMHSAMGEDFLAHALRLVMPMLAAPPSRMAAGMPVPNMPRYPANLYISNVPGPSGPLYLAGKQMLTFYPAAFLPRAVGLNMVVLSYLGSLHFGLMACPDLVTDIQGLMDHVVEAVKELSNAAEAVIQ
jgi:diacylglycerol O-acyltransferase / wax synthase